METAYLKISDAREMNAQQLKTSKIKDMLSNNKNSKNANNGGESRIITVQFNPSTLKFGSSLYEEVSEKTGIDHRADGKKEHADSKVEGSNISVSMDLIFDRSIYKDSSVQPEVEAFIAMVKNPYIRNVEFFWGDMYYGGVVNGIDAEYTLFNNQGVPIRAKVGLTIHIKSGALSSK